MKFRKAILFLLLWAAAWGATYTYHTDIPKYNWRSQIFADQAGFYVYNPALFIYGFHTDRFPKDIDKLTGDGFKLDHSNDKIFTKFPVGVAILQLPFFLATHIIVEISGGQSDGFSAPYQNAVDLAGTFYLVLAFFLLYSILKNYYKRRNILLVFAVLFAGTNLFSYMLIGSGFSHIYSFFLFSLLLFLIKRYLAGKQAVSVMHLAFTGFVCGMIIIVRPINVVALLLLFFYDISSKQELMQRLKTIFRPASLAALVISGLIAILPQLVYWHYLTGSFVFYSYQNEGFPYWNEPRVLEVLCSPRCGAFFYNPVLLFAFSGLLWMAIRRVKNGILFLIMLTYLIYITASWHCYTFADGYGCRNMIEYYPLLIIASLYFLDKIINWKLVFKLIIAFFALVMIVANVKVLFAPKGIFQGDWDYAEYRYYVCPWNIDVATDFENKYSTLLTSPNGILDTAVAVSGNQVLEVDNSASYSTGMIINQSNIPDHLFIPLALFRDAKVSFMLCSQDLIRDASVVMYIERQGDVRYWFACKLDDYSHPGKWQKMNYDFNALPGKLSNSTNIYVRFINHSGSGFLVDDLKVTLKYKKRNIIIKSHS